MMTGLLSVATQDRRTATLFYTDLGKGKIPYVTACHLPILSKSNGVNVIAKGFVDF